MKTAFGRSFFVRLAFGMSEVGGGLNLSAQHSKYSAAQRSEIWDRWQAGEPMSSIGRRFDRESSSISEILNINNLTYSNNTNSTCCGVGYSLDLLN
jgi:hypothetical protein